MQTLSAQLTKDGGYMVPSLPASASMEEHENSWKNVKANPGQ